MKPRYRKFRQKWGVYYVLDTETGRPKSLGTRDAHDADRQVHAMNEAARAPQINRQMARAYLAASDPESLSRTWQVVMEAKLKTVSGPTRSRWETAIRDKAFDLIRSRKLIETRPEDFRMTLRAGTVATNVFLRKLHNLALDMNWLLGPVLVKPQWPKVQYASKRAITEEEHRRICERERNEERRAFYELCWHLGGSQGDIASLNAQNIDWTQETVSYHRHKTGEHAEIQIGPELASILRILPSTGPLFPYLCTVRAGDRATEFKQRCQKLGIQGVTLHSYRYAWAQRAKAMGYPERFAQQALGHSSKAVHRAYSKGGGARVLSLDAWKKQMNENVVRADFGTQTGGPTDEAAAEATGGTAHS